jgi:peptidoglycan/LPS O-acetylase OafA/YrhL
VFVSHLVFLQQEIYPEAVGFGVNPILWSMSLIVICYLALAALARWYLRHPVLGLAVAVAFSTGWRLVFENIENNWAFLQAPVYMTAFALGMSGSLFYVWLHRRIGSATLRPFALPAFAVAGAALVGVLYVNGHGVVERDWPSFAEPIALTIAIPAVFLAVVLSSAFAPRWVQWPFANRGSRWLGEVSYGIFLFHGPVAVLALEAEPGLLGEFTLEAMLALTAIVVPGSLILAWLSLELLERPLRARARAIARRYEGPREAQVAEPAAVPAVATHAAGGR